MWVKWMSSQVSFGDVGVGFEMRGSYRYGCITLDELLQCVISDRQPLQLGLFRSDYLLHAPGNGEPISLRQVEFNTISSSFGALSERAADLHE